MLTHIEQPFLLRAAWNEWVPAVADSRKQVCGTFKCETAHLCTQNAGRLHWSTKDADRVPSEIASMVRVKTKNPSAREEEYIRAYYRRSQLLVVAPEMVHHHLRRCAQNNNWGTLLDEYFGLHRTPIVSASVLWIATLLIHADNSRQYGFR